MRLLQRLGTFVVLGSLLPPFAGRAAAQSVNPDDILYILPLWDKFSAASDAAFAAEVATLRSRIGEGMYVKVGFSVYIYLSMTDWSVDITNPLAVRAALAGPIAQIDAVIARARQHGIPIGLSILTPIRNDTDAVQRASEAEDIRSMQWYSDNALAPGWWNYSRYARKQRAVQEAYVREIGRVLAARMRLYPETLVAASGDGEIELSYERAPNFYADYSPLTVAEFRDWIRHGGLYAPGQSLAGQGYDLGSRYAGDVSPAADTNSDGHTLNGDFGTAFQSWNLLHFDWSLSDPYLLADPGAIPLASYNGSSWVRLPGAIAGGFDAPRAPNRGNAWWDLWFLFKQTQIWRHNLDFARWMTTTPDETGASVPRQRWYSYQVPADYLFNGTPDNPNERFLSSASAWWTADIAPYGSVGITAFNIDLGGGAIARTLSQVAPLIAARDRRWGIVEWNPSVPPDASTPRSDSLELHRSEMALVEQYRPSLLVPFAWGSAFYKILDTGFETALREVVGRIKDSTPSDPRLAIESPAAGAAAQQPVQLRGWAVDLGKIRGPGRGPGIDQIHVYAYPHPGSGRPPIFLGAAAYGSTRSDVAASFGTQFTSSGYQLTIRDLPAGPYQFVVYGRSTVSNTFGVVQSVTATISVNGPVGAPFGAFDTPQSGPTFLSGSIAVTGWALDDAGIDRVEIWRDVAPNETTPPYSGPGPGNGKIYIANGLFVDGSRPDIETTYAAYPLASRAGWGYLMLTWGLWNQGNGTYTLYAFAFDKEGNSSTLGTKTITVSNAQATKPFGGLDTPQYGQTVSGGFWVYGWALTPNVSPSCTITNGNVWVSVDSGSLQSVDYGAARPDIAGAFPGFTNGSNAGGAFYLDTTTLSNGTHSIGWLVTDSCGRSDGIGGRFFTVLNGASSTSESSPSRK